MDVHKFRRQSEEEEGQRVWVLELLRLMVVEAAGVVTRDDCSRVWRDVGVIVASVDARSRWVLRTLDSLIGGS
jgi:hypothetical protein